MRSMVHVLSFAIEANRGTVELVPKVDGESFVRIVGSYEAARGLIAARVAREQVHGTCCSVTGPLPPSPGKKASDVKVAERGGTDMRVGITTAQALRPTPDLIVVPTDGYTPWADRPTSRPPRHRSHRQRPCAAQYPSGPGPGIERCWRLMLTRRLPCLWCPTYSRRSSAGVSRAATPGRVAADTTSAPPSAATNMSSTIPSSPAPATPP